jgi:hypothetical protein
MAVNSIWFHGQGALTRPADNRPAPFSALYSDALALRGLAHAFETPAARLPANYAALANAGDGGRAGAKTDISSISRAAPVLIDVGSLSLPFIQQDWGLWLQHLSDIDAQWIAPALADLRSGALSELRLTLGSDTGTVTLTLSRMDLKKFWRRRAWATIQ